jgi:hypothetical protein
MLSHVRLVWEQFWIVGDVAIRMETEGHPGCRPPPPQCWRKAGDAWLDHSTGIILAKFGWIA